MVGSDDWRGIGSKLKDVSVQALETTLAEAIAKLVGESPGKIEVTVKKVDYGARVGFDLGAEMLLTLGAHFEFMPPSKQEALTSEAAVAPPEGRAWTYEGDSLMAMANRLASPEARAERIEKALLYYRAALGAYKADVFPNEHRAVQEKITQAEAALSDRQSPKEE